MDPFGIVVLSETRAAPGRSTDFLETAEGCLGHAVLRRLYGHVRGVHGGLPLVAHCQPARVDSGVHAVRRSPAGRAASFLRDFSTPQTIPGAFPEANAPGHLWSAPRVLDRDDGHVFSCPPAGSGPFSG